MTEKMDMYYDKAMDMVMTYGPKLLLAIATLIIGNFIIKIITNIFAKALGRMNLDDSLRPYVVAIVRTLLKVMLLISVAGMIGIETTSFVAVIGAAGLAIGMALQGSLANFAGGFLILVFKPFKIGDYIKSQGFEGVVSEIQVFCTVLKTLDNQTIFLPNGGLAGNAVQNLTFEDERRVDMTFGIGYGDDIDKARGVFQKVVDDNAHILKSKPVDIYVSELGDSSVNFAVRPWCKKEHYWDVYFDIHEKVKKSLDANGISIPFPQRDIHVVTDVKAK